MLPAMFATAGNAGASSTVLGGIVTSDMLAGVMAEITGMLPIIIPVTISYIAIRKGLSFLFSSLRKA